MSWKKSQESRVILQIVMAEHRTRVAANYTSEAIVGNRSLFAERLQSLPVGASRLDVVQAKV